MERKDNTSLLKMLLVYRSDIKYADGSLEKKYADFINNDIDALKDSELLWDNFNYLVSAIIRRFNEYKNEVLARSSIDIGLCDVECECSFDEFVKQVNEFVNFYERKRKLIQYVDERIHEITCDKDVNIRIPFYILEIKRKVRNIDLLASLEDFENNIDDKLNDLENMVSDYNYYKAKVMKLRDIIGEYAPETLFAYLHEYEKAIMEGKYEKTETIIVRMNVGLRTLKSRKYSVNYSWNIIKGNYENKIANLNKSDKILANEILEIIKSILIDILRGYENPDILRKLMQISFTSMKEIDTLETYKTRNLYVSKKPDDNIEILLRVDSDHKFIYCYGGKIGCFQEFKISGGMLSLKYTRALELFGKNNNYYSNYLSKLLEFLDIAEMNGENKVALINKIVECMELNRDEYLKDSYDEIYLQRKLVKDQGGNNEL